MSIKILDCTLRDGGYINNWEFTNKDLISIVTALEKSRIDIVECGYLTDKKARVNESSLFNRLEDLDHLISGHESKTEKIVMINHGDYDVNNLPDKDDTNITGIRLAFKKPKINEVLNESKIIIEKGYQLYFQPMLTSNYSDTELKNLISEVNKLDIHAFYIVDSFGTINNNELRRLFTISDTNLNPQTIIGLHSHNNMQLAFSNAIEFISNVTKRDIIVDSTIYGMGRGAGNLNTELISSFLNENMEADYVVEYLLDVIDNYLESIKRDSEWGYSVAYYLSSKFKVHPNYATFLINKRTILVKEMSEILKEITPEFKDNYNKQYIEGLYNLYQSKNSITSQEIDFKSDEVLILASGENALKDKSNIISFINNKKASVIIVNHISSIVKGDYYFFSNQIRFDEFISDIDKGSPIIVTSNINYTGDNTNITKVSYRTLHDENDIKSGNVAALAMNLLILNGLKNVYVAGLDGYDLNQGPQYSYKETAVTFDKEVLKEKNMEIESSIKKLAKFININFITKSIFNKKQQILGIIPARYKSSRLEGKPLVKINGVPMLKRTYLQAVKSNLLSKVVIATDDSRIEEFCKSENMPVIMTSENCMTGTDRLAEVATKMHYDLYVNIQGDEPVIDPSTIDKIVEEFNKHGDKYIAYNLYKIIDDQDEVNSDTIIKVIVNNNDELVTMSRLPIPYNKSGKSNQEYKKQVCVYGFTPEALKVFSSVKEKTLNEQYEDIELLRFLDLGYRVKMSHSQVDCIAVDVPDDVLKVEKFLNERGLK